MKEIRLCWVSVRTTGPYREAIVFGSWTPDNEKSRKELQAIVVAGTQVWGEGSHWIQERELETL